MSAVSAPCKNCKKRELGCHNKCEAYQEFHSDRERIYKIRHDIMLQREDSVHKRRQSWQLKRSEGIGTDTLRR